MNGSRATFPELSAEEARRMVDLSTLQFTTTAELEPLTTLVGQERATQALHMGLGMHQQGYNIFVCGFEGTGAQTQIAALLRERAATLPTPGDWVYVHNFRYPDQPQALGLHAGQGRRLQQDMVRLVAHLREALPKAFRQEAFEREQRELGEKYQQEVRQIQEAFHRLVQEKGFDFQADATGNVAFIPLRHGRPMSPEEIERLTDAERQALERHQSDVLHEFRTAMLQQRQLMQRLAEDIRAIERNFSATLIAPVIAELKRQHPQEPVQRYLDAVQEHMLSQLDLFKDGGRSSQAGPLSFPPRC